MARKDFDMYFRQVSKQYRGLELTLEDMSQEVENKMMEPERLEQLKATILPVKNNYETLNYIRYLLDKPNRKSKHKRYEGQSKKLLSRCGDKTSEKVLQRNQDIIDGISKIV